MRISASPRIPKGLRAVKLAHPIFFALAPVIWLFANNFGEIFPESIYRSLIVAVIGAILVSVLLGLGTRNWHKGAAIASVSILLFSAYGHIYAYFEPIHILGIQIGRHRYLLPVFAILTAVLAYLILTKTKDQKRLTGTFAGLGFAILLVPIFLLASKVALTSKGYPVSLSQRASPANASTHVFPDVYYIILDGYARFDVLDIDFSLDSSEFRDFLESRGFFVADRSNSNFMWTALSLSSSLNMELVQDIELPLIFGSYPAIFTDPIRHGRVRLELERLGYSTAAFESGYLPTELVDADYYYRSTDSDLGDKSLQAPNTFETVLARSTAASIILDYLGSGVYSWFTFRDRTQTDVLRGIILDEFSNLEASVGLPSPKFVFAHIISPHDPYLFGRKGEHINPQPDANLLADGGVEQSFSRAELYRAQLIYITDVIMETIDAILDQSGEPPIIILQADHGPGFGAGWHIEGGERIWTRLAILNAYHFPGDCSDQLYPEITPVNSFRVILSCYFDLPYPLVADASYFTYWPRRYPYSFTEVDVSDGSAVITEGSK